MMAILFKLFGFIAFQNFKLFGFPIFPFWAYLMVVIPETRRAHEIWYLRFYLIYIHMKLQFFKNIIKKLIHIQFYINKT